MELLIAGLFLWLTLLLEEWTYRKAHTEVFDRWRLGDHTCNVEKCWYGWRVKEYAECEL